MQGFLSQRLRKARVQLELTQAEAASAIGITQPMLHRAETTMNLSSGRLLQIIDYYVNRRNVNPAWLLSQSNTAYTTFITDETDAALTDQEKLRLLKGFREKLDGIDKPGDPPTGEKG